ncbi:MAG: serine/threonine-protein kinase, partial [Pirellulaceae bacterium]
MGTTISNRYEILSEIGRGGFATVYRALDKKLGREVAIKRLRLDANADDSQDRITRFIREAQLIASLNHRNIVHVYDHDTDDLGHYIVMEYIPGLSLAAYCKQEGAIAPLKAVELIQGVCLGLSYAHRKQLIHRDIKPANILLLEEDDELIPKIVDFGLARIGSHSDISETGYFLGTPFYMAPEQMGDIKSTTH